MKQPKIEDGVPIPQGRAGSGLTATLRKLKVGQSFLVEAVQRNAVHTAARNVFGKGGHVATRAEEGLIRVWRIK